MAEEDRQDGRGQHRRKADHDLRGTPPLRLAARTAAPQAVNASSSLAGVTMKKNKRPKDSAPVARWMITSRLFHSTQVPNRKRQANRLACRRPKED